MEILMSDPKIHYAANLNEAIEMAQTFKDSGKFDLFRGQTQDWPPYSSLYRILSSENTVEIEKAELRVRILKAWLQKIPELSYLLNPENEHHFYAVMQHYGIPTHYIDFTKNPDVAGFFASYTENPPTDGYACIYCIDSKELENFSKHLHLLRSSEVEITKIEVDVSNLWRLSSQEGVFILTNYNWDVDFQLDRILFPYTPPLPHPTREKIYPIHKSTLEQLLDQFFQNESAVFMNREIEEILKKTDSAKCKVETFQNGYYIPAFKYNYEQLIHESWIPELEEKWSYNKSEDYKLTVGESIEINIYDIGNVSEYKSNIELFILDILNSKPDMRNKAINWVFVNDFQNDLKTEVRSKFQNLWNGIRLLPYSNKEISEAFGKLLELILTRHTNSGKNKKEIIKEIFHDCVEIGMTQDDNSSSIGWATLENLGSIIRDDIASLVTPEYSADINEIFYLFGIVYNPKILFQADKFPTFFVQEIIPSQIFLNRKPIIFNPIKIKIFGVP